MAKRKAARPASSRSGRKAAKGAKAAAGSRGGGRKTAARKRPAPARAVARKGGTKRAAPAAKAKKTAAARKTSAPATSTRARGGASRSVKPRSSAAPPKAVAATARKTPALNRERRVIRDEDDVTPTPPSSLDLDRTASAARTGRRELLERFEHHNETSPAMTAGDVDADWEGAYSSGDEAPGGDNPTPDQDIVDDIGRAVGVEYQDNEELKGEDKIAQRDRKRWELDPASSEDYDDR